MKNNINNKFFFIKNKYNLIGKFTINFANNYV